MEQGKTLIVADYGQLELRLLAHMAGCVSMKEAFRLGGDFHSRTALSMYDHIKEAIAEGKSRTLLSPETLSTANTAVSRGSRHSYPVRSACKTTSSRPSHRVTFVNPEANTSAGLISGPSHAPRSACTTTSRRTSHKVRNEETR